MINSRNRRASILGLTLASLVVLPAPDGAIDAADRAQVATSYAEDIGTPAVVPQPLEQVFGVVTRRLPPLPVRVVFIQGEGNVHAPPPTVHGEGRVVQVIRGHGNMEASAASVSAREATYTDLQREVLRLQKLLAHERSISERIAKEMKS